MRVCSRCKAHRDEARALDDDPLVDSVDHVGLLLNEIRLLPRLRERIEPLHCTAGRQIPGRLLFDDPQFSAEMRHPGEVLRVGEALGGRLGAFVLHSRYDSRELTRPARTAFWSKFEHDVDPEGVLPLEERLRRAEMARKAHFTRLALKSAQVRRRRKARRQRDAESYGSHTDALGPSPVRSPHEG